MAFIGLDRGIVDHWIYQDAEYFKVWFEMLYRARYSLEPSIELIEGQLTEIKHGEFIFGRIKWSERLGISERRLRTLMDKLIAENMIILVKRAPKFSLYCVSNFAKYRPQNDQQEDLEQKGIETHADHQNDQQTTSKRPADVQQTTTKEQGSNKGNKVNKDKEIKESSRKRPVYEPDSIPYRSASYLLKKIREHSPGIKTPNLQQWANDMRLMIETDKREPITIANVIDWATADGFWQTNILSASKLREKFDALQIQMKRGGNNGHVVSDSGSIQQHTEPETDWNKFVYRGPA